MGGRKTPVRGKGSLGLRKSAQEVLDNIGGADNVVSAAHCATRLLLGIMNALNLQDCRPGLGHALWYPAVPGSARAFTRRPTACPLMLRVLALPITHSVSRRFVAYRRYTAAVAHDAGNIRIVGFCF